MRKGKDFAFIKIKCSIFFYFFKLGKNVWLNVTSEQKLQTIICDYWGMARNIKKKNEGDVEIRSTT